ncbi:hypothetical protein GCM10011369_23490 [Neiella marina]|uniref:Fibronectin type-III domain-containing protein n=1 Tax=Neiella marina TaxID=508461 RepID=A0A8J2XMT0_9GAMM|nr:hypothetical protein [Neiella marina]GGA80823.1 hypothetical protein GCM10011369_23490 [Neiella marina]
MGIFDWFVEDVLGIDIPDQTSPYERGQDVTIYSTEAYLPIIKGVVKDAEPVVVAFAGTSGDGTNDKIENDLIHKVFVFGKQVQSIDAVRIDGVDSESEDWQDKKGNRWLHVRKFPNGMSGYYWEYLQKSGFKSDYKFTDCCCVYVVAETGSEVVTSEPNDVRADLTGVPVSSSLDSSATATQRLHNNVDHFYRWLTSDSSGPKWPTSMLNLSSWQQAAADCNIQIETFEGSGEYQSRYTFDKAVDTSLKTHEIIKLFRESVRAHMPFDHSTGKYDLILEQDDNYAAIEITEADIDGGIRTNESADVGQKVNQVIVKFPDADQNGKTAEAIYPEPGSAIDLQWLAEDNQQRKTKTVNLDACNNYYLAMQQAKIEAEHSREGLLSRFTVKPRVYKLKPGQVVKVTVAERGWNQKPFRILGKTLHKDLFSDLSLREHQPYIYDYHNTGEKPAIPDTIIDPKKLAEPTGLTVTGSAYGGKKATWISAYSKFDWQLETAAGSIVDSGSVNTNSLELAKLVSGTSYVLAIRARNNAGKVSNWVESAVFVYVKTITDDNTPNNPLNPSVPAPEVDDPLTQDEYVWKVYYDTIDHGDAPDTQAAYYGGLVDHATGQTFIIPDALPNTEYFIWFGLLKKELSADLATTWVKHTVTSGAGLGTDHFLDDVREAIDRATPDGELDQIIDDTKSRLETDITNTKANLEAELGYSALDALEALLETNEQNFLTAEYVEQINGWQLQIEEQLGQLIIEGGAVTASEFASYQLLVDAHAGKLSSIATWQGEVDGTLTQHSTQILQNAEQIALIAGAVEDGDIYTRLDQVELELDGVNNAITSTAISATYSDFEALEQALASGETALDLVEQGLSLGVAKEQIQSQSNELSAQAEILEQTQSIASGGQAAAQQALRSISDEKEQRAEFEQQIYAELEQSNSFISENQTAIATQEEALAIVEQALSANRDDLDATIISVSQVRTTANGNAEAINSLQLVVGSESTGLQGEVNNLSSVVLDEQTGLVQAFNAMSATVGDEQSGLVADVTTVQAAIYDEDTGLLQAYNNLSATVGDDNSGMVKSVLDLSATQDDQQDEIDSLKGAVTIGVDVNGNFTGIYIEGTKQASTIKFTAGEFSLWDSIKNQDALIWESGKGWRFRGRVAAEDIDGDTVSAMVKSIETTHMSFTTAPGSPTEDDSPLLSVTVNKSFPRTRKLVIQGVNVFISFTATGDAARGTADILIRPSWTPGLSESGGLTQIDNATNGQSYQQKFLMPPIVVDVPANKTGSVDFYLRASGFQASNLAVIASSQDGAYISLVPESTDLS